MTFSDFVGHEDAKLALILNAVDPNCGGVLFVGEKGSGKSTLPRLFKELLPVGTPFLELPLNVTEDALLGHTDIEKTIRTGRRIFQEGILNRADKGVIHIDDINLLPHEITARVLESQGRGESIVEREGFTCRYSSRFILIAGMNREEGALSPHVLDRFGMCVLWEKIGEISQRVKVVRESCREVFVPVGDTELDEDLRGRIIAGRALVDHVVVPADVEEHIAQACVENYIPGHRGDLFLFYASRAYTAFCGDTVVTKKHVDKLSPLVLGHRQKVLRQTEQRREQQEREQDRTPEQDKKAGNNSQSEQQNREASGSDMPHGDSGAEGSPDFESRPRESRPREDVFETGSTFRTRRLAFKRDRVARSAQGRRTATRAKDRGGRYVKSILRGKVDDLAIDATLRAAAPFQRMRGRNGILAIRREDWRFKQREKKMGHLAVFVVDGSGSMGVQRRMIETKGAIQSLLTDCYQKRDRVSMIVFRKDRAELLLPPTSSLELASKRLKEIPVGGKTPLTAGLLEAYRLVKREAHRRPETRFLVVLITDGRANHAVTDAPVSEEMGKVVEILRELRYTDYIVVDTEPKNSFLRADLAVQITSKLDADYYRLEDLRSDYLAGIVQMNRSRLG